MLLKLDLELFHFINRTCVNPFFDFIMPLVSEAGSGELLFAASVAMILLGKKDIRKAGILLLAGMSLTYYLTTLIKDFTARPRPFMTLADVRCLADTGGFSFPSGHAVQSFMASTILSKYFKRYTVYFFIVAVLIAFSRVYLGVHFISDVTAGAVVGWIIGYGLVSLAREK